MDLRVIFDGSLSPNVIGQSQFFTKGQFILFNTPGLQPGEGLIIGMSLVVQVPVLFGTVERIIPTTLLTEELSLTLDTNLVYYLPREISESDYQCFVYLNSARSIDSFIAYVVTSEATQESLKEAIEENRQLLQQLDSKIEQVNAKVDQLLALAVVPVSASLSPSTVPTLTNEISINGQPVQIEITSNVPQTDTLALFIKPV